MDISLWQHTFVSRHFAQYVVTSYGLLLAHVYQDKRQDVTDHGYELSAFEALDWALQIHTHPFNDPFSRTTRVSQYQKGKTNLDFTEARDIEWQWHQLGHMQVCTSLQTDNHASTPPLSFLQAGCPSCLPTNRVKALKAATDNVN